jgi:beta-aspartyl-peptidase (threonine type)
MDGYSLRAGAVAGVSRLRNPVLAARLVMERSPHVLLVGEGAEKFAFAEGWSRCRPIFFDAGALRAACRPRGGQTVLDHGGAPLDETKKWAPSVRWRWISRKPGGGDLDRRHDQ